MSVCRVTAGALAVIRWNTFFNNKAVKGSSFSGEFALPSLSLLLFIVIIDYRGEFSVPYLPLLWLSCWLLRRIHQGKATSDRFTLRSVIKSARAHIGRWDVVLM